MDIASPIVGFIGLANLVLTGVSSLIDFFGRIKEAPAYIKAIQLELGIIQDLLLAARASYKYIQAAGDVKSLETAVDICQSEVAKLEKLIRRFYPELSLGGWEQKWSQVSVALRQKRFTKYHNGLRRARALLFTVQSYTEMPLRFHQYSMVKPLRNKLSDLALMGVSTRAAVDLTNSSVLDFQKDLHRLSFDHTKIASFISSMENRLGQIDGDLYTVSNAAQQLLEFHASFEDRLVQVFKPSIELAISETITKHLHREQGTIMGEEVYLQSNSTTTNLLKLAHVRSLNGFNDLSALVETSIKTAAGTEVWTLGKPNVLSSVQPNHRRPSFGYLAIQSTRGIFYKIGKPYGPRDDLKTTVVLIPAKCLCSKGAFSSLVEFASGLNSPQFDFEVVPVLETQTACSKFHVFRAGDPESLVQLFESLMVWLGDLSCGPETPLIISIRLSGNKHKETPRCWYLMQLLAQGMLSSGVELFSPTVGLWKSLCPKERIIALKAQEALAQKYPELWRDDPASQQDGYSIMQRYILFCAAAQEYEIRPLHTEATVAAQGKANRSTSVNYLRSTELLRLKVGIAWKSETGTLNYRKYAGHTVTLLL
ncbi:hypothetical protein MMC27_005039 [Xylographa pallens]|nr:hypothetical protein [Xylographa pallens]